MMIRLWFYCVHFVDTLLYKNDSFSLEDVKTFLNYRVEKLSVRES